MLCLGVSDDAMERSLLQSTDRAQLLSSADDSLLAAGEHWRVVEGGARDE